MLPRRSQRTYDQRLVQLVRETGDVDLATRHGVPCPTASGWTRRQPPKAVTISKTEAGERQLRVRLVRLERRARRLETVLRVLLALFQILQPDLERLRVPRAADKSPLLRAIDRSRGVLGLSRVLHPFGSRHYDSACGGVPPRRANSKTPPHALAPRLSG